MIRQLFFRMARICPLRFFRNLIQLPQFGKSFARARRTRWGEADNGQEKRRTRKGDGGGSLGCVATSLLSILQPRKTRTKAVLGTSSGNNMRTDFYFRLPESGLQS